MRKILSVFIAVLVICGACVFAYATPNNPYSYGCHFGPSGADNIGTAYTDKCSCNPVDNMLAARVKVQCLLGDNYSNTNWSAWVKKENVRSSYVSAYGAAGSRCTYVWGEHDGRCGSGSDIKRSSYASR